MKARKILVSVAALALVAAISIGGTLAYLTSKTDTIKNTFTVGNVHITLTEAQTDEQGNGEKVLDKDGNEIRITTGNQYNLKPNHEYSKDPTVTVLPNSEEAYVRMLVTVTFDGDLRKLAQESGANMEILNALEDPSDIFIGGSENWVRADENDATTEERADGSTYTKLVMEYRYYKTVTNNTNNPFDLEPLFESVKIPENWDNAELNTFGGFKIEIVAEAIQADGFEADAAKDMTAEDVAWAAFDEQKTNG